MTRLSAMPAPRTSAMPAPRTSAMPAPRTSAMPAPRSPAGVLRGLVLGLALASLITGCVVRHLVGPRLTGTCEGACSHYTDCKRGATRADRDRCRAECPDVFSDRDSLMAYESLSCADAVEYVDGSQRQIATPR